MPNRLPRRSLLAAMLAVWAAGGLAADVSDVAAVPHLDARGQAGYREFLAITPPRAFAVAPGGAWGYSIEAADPAMAEREALANCQANTLQRCLIYARDDAVVLNRAEWARAWGPYKSRADAARAATGTLPGARLADLAFKDAKGRPVKLSDLRGKVVVLHFWGSWCPPCQRELPDLVRLAEAAKGDNDIRFVFLQVREGFGQAGSLARKIGRGLPVWYDSGMTDRRDAEFRLADGGRLPDRALAMAFPTTYVLDKRGIVLFGHVGPVADWSQYLALLRDAAARSGK
ncbi:TlpA family protein disulfide reductase [Parasulfuritortus cantonensis]|uniref:TlpA family protein disulfide reductase n=1 Tax=Parasulfuritortus cantonensis TaxID=2528202 RepID=A0A4R1BEA3_9PROT|nr:TlpA disulfide reductase family protein [Parasulfuritortus cantonensis]TCJ15439.1 TlpA family protein disulfide reductase [Parasulfuritortus cantonensis]